VIYVSWWFAFAAMLATPPHTPEAAASRVLRDTRASAAARVAVGVAALSIEGMKRSFGLAGSYDEVIDLRTGAIAGTRGTRFSLMAQVAIAAVVGARILPKSRTG